jgi:hypothetical protein
MAVGILLLSLQGLAQGLLTGIKLDFLQVQARRKLTSCNPLSHLGADARHWHSSVPGVQGLSGWARQVQFGAWPPAIRGGSHGFPGSVLQEQPSCPVQVGGESVVPFGGKQILIFWPAAVISEQQLPLQGARLSQLSVRETGPTGLLQS